jgi:hypothetical protein
MWYPSVPIYNELYWLNGGTHDGCYHDGGKSREWLVTPTAG